MPGNSAFTIEDAPAEEKSSGQFSIEDAPPPQQASQSVSKSPRPNDNPFAMIGEGEETEAKGRAAMAPAVVPGAAAEAASMLGGPAAGSAAYAGTKYLMDPEGVKAHPYRTAAETAGVAVTPYVLKSAGEFLAPTFQKLSQNVGRVYDYLTTPILKAGEEAAPAALPAATATSAAPVAGPQVGKVTHIPPSPSPGPPLTNRQIAGKIVSTVKQAAGTTDQTPIFPRAAQGTVGAKTVVEQPNTEIAGPPIATPSRDKTLVNYAGENVEKSAAQVPMKPRNENAFYKDFSPRERQDIHTNMEVRTPNGYEPIPNAEAHWERLSKTPEVREDLFKMQNDQVREALRKSGLVDMQNKTVKSSDWTFQGKQGKPFRDPNVIPRAKALSMMMEKGIPDEDIIKWGGGEETRSKPYMPRTTAGPSREGLAAGPADRGYPEKPKK